MSALQQKLKTYIASAPVFVISRGGCPYCTKVKAFLNQKSVDFKSVELDAEPDYENLHKELIKMSGHETFPAVFVKGQLVGGCDDTHAKWATGEFQKLLSH